MLNSVYFHIQSLVHNGRWPQLDGKGTDDGNLNTVGHLFSLSING